MMNPLRAAAVLVSLAVCLASGACAPRRIPGTDLDDTPEVRALLMLMEQYRTAVEARDAAKLVELASPTFQDDGGTATPEDDLDYETLKTQLPQRLAKVSDVKLDLDVRKVDVAEDKKRAVATYYFVARFRPAGADTKTQREMDLKQMTFVNEQGAWKITSGY